MAENESHPEPEAAAVANDRGVQRVQVHASTVGGGRTGEQTRNPEEETGGATGEEGGREVSEQTRAECQARRSQQARSQLQQQRTTDTQADRRVESSPEHTSYAFHDQRVCKKSSLNNKLTLYLISRDLIVSDSKIDKLYGVLLIDPDYLKDKRVYGQVTLTFRYGREDEEVMGLKFCNEAVMCLAQLYPPYSGADRQDTMTPLQEALVQRLGPNAHAFTMEITPLAPPSVQLVPAKKYNGAPIGTSYDVRAYVADRADERLRRKTIIKMGIRVIQRTSKPPLPTTTMYSVSPTTAPSISSRNPTSETRAKFAENDILEDDENVGPHAAIEKPFLLSDGRVGLEAGLDRAIYAHGDTITVHVTVNNNSSKSVRSIKIFVVQHVDVCMFSNGKFKNVVASVSSHEGCPVGPGVTLKKSYTLRPIKGSTKNWIALEDSYAKAGATLASTVICPGNGPDDRNIFAIYVSYYVKVKLLISAMGGAVSLKLPFTLMHSNTDPDLVGFPSPLREPARHCEKASEACTESPRRRDGQQRNRENKLGDIEERESTVAADVDLIERCDEGDGT